MNVSKKKLELGVGLIDRLTSEEFNPENQKTSTASACSGCSMRKAKAKKSLPTKRQRRSTARVIDIMGALKRSMERIRAKKKPAPAAATKEEKERLLG